MRKRRESGALSTSVGQPNPTSSWKQEVSLRIAAHKSRRGSSTAVPETPAQTWSAASSRAAQAAARVAARYAQAPSYSQMQAAEAQAAPRPVETSLPTAVKECVAVQPAPAELEVVAAPPQPLEPHTVVSERPLVRKWEPPVALPLSAVPASLEDWESECSHIHREPDLRLLPLAPRPGQTSSLAPATIEKYAAPTVEEPAFSAVSSLLRQKWEWPALAEEPSTSDSIEPVEPDLPIHANLIEFPRELIAARRMRPRRAEGPFAAAKTEAQLSIFEVDPGAISTHPEPVLATALAAWPEPVWSEIELEPQLQDDAEHDENTATLPELQLASFSRRSSAALVDGALVTGIFLSFVLATASRFGHLPLTKTVEIGVVAALLFLGLLYHALFLVLAGATPGMKCAGISLCTFDGQIPTREQLRGRLGALLLSVVPVGFGIAWALFDDGHLCWHDRLSRTYLRKN